MFYVLLISSLPAVGGGGQSLQLFAKSVSDDQSFKD